jgi:chromosomal replication initiator protein
MKYEIEKISKTVATELGFELEALKTKSRKRENVEARMMCMTLCWENKVGSLKEIGLFFGGRDHSTVIHARQTIWDLCDTDRHIKAIYKRIKNLVEKTALADIDSYSASMLSMAAYLE